MILFGYENDTSDPAFRGIIFIMEVVFQESPSVIPTDFRSWGKAPIAQAPLSYAELT